LHALCVFLRDGKRISGKAPTAEESKKRMNRNFPLRVFPDPVGILQHPAFFHVPRSAERISCFAVMK
jgi:hypothetical protein